MYSSSTLLIPSDGNAESSRTLRCLNENEALKRIVAIICSIYSKELAAIAIVSAGEVSTCVVPGVTEDTVGVL